MTRTTRRSSRTRLATAAVLAPLALTLAACGGDDADTADDPAPAASESTTETPADAATQEPTDGTAGDDTTGTGSGGDLETAVQTALGAVEGTVFSVDRDDDGWDVTIVTAEGVENDVDIAADATSIVRGPVEDTDADNDDAAETERLLGVSTDWAAALDAARAESQGTPTGVSLDEDGGTALWEVQFDEDTPDELTVHVDAGSGEVVHVERDD